MQKPQRNTADRSPALLPREISPKTTQLEEARLTLAKQGYITEETTPSKADCALILEQMAIAAQVSTGTKPTLACSNKALANLRLGIAAVVAVLRGQEIMETLEIARDFMEELRDEMKESLETDVLEGAHLQMNVIHNDWDTGAKEHRDSLTTQVTKVEKQVTKVEKQVEKVERLLQTSQSSLEEGELPRAKHPLSYAYPPSPPQDPDLQPAIEQTRRLESQLVIQRDPNPLITFDALDGLSPDEIVVKANTAIGTLRRDETDFVGIVGAKRMRGGAVVLHPSTPVIGAWLRSPGTILALSKELATLVVRPVVLEVMVKFVPIHLVVDSVDFLRAVERDNNLESFDLRSARWVKKEAKRHSHQRVANLMLGFASANAANKFTGGGRASIASEMLPVSRPTTQPQRCLKCQRLGCAHIAATCKQPHDTCGRCAGHHRTSDCSETTEANYHCSNCNMPGHGAVSSDCPTFLAKIDDMQTKNPYTNYIFFPTESPLTWGRIQPVHQQSYPQMDAEGFTAVNRQPQRLTRHKNKSLRRPSPSANAHPLAATTHIWRQHSPTNDEMFKLADNIPLPPSQSSSTTVHTVINSPTLSPPQVKTRERAATTSNTSP